MDLQHTTMGLHSECLSEVVHAYMANGTVRSLHSVSLNFERSDMHCATQVPDSNITVCDADADFHVFPGVTVREVLAELPNAGF